MTLTDLVWLLALCMGMLVLLAQIEGPDEGGGNINPPPTGPKSPAPPPAPPVDTPRKEGSE